MYIPISQPTDCIEYVEVPNAAKAGAWTGKLAKQLQAAHAEAYGSA